MNPGRVNFVTKSSRFSSFTDDANFLAKRAIQLFKDSGISPTDVRGMGLQMESLDNQTSISTKEKKKNSPLGNSNTKGNSPKRENVNKILNFSLLGSQSKLTSFFAVKK